MESARRAGDDPNKLPFIQNRPRIPIHLERFWRAWITHLSTCRGDFGVPWTAIRDYAETCGWSRGDLFYMAAVSRILDREFAAIRMAEMKKSGT